MNTRLVVFVFGIAILGSANAVEARRDKGQRYDKQHVQQLQHPSPGT